MLSKMFKTGIIDFPEHAGIPVAVLVGHGGLGRSIADAQVVEVPRGGPQSVADVTHRRADCKLAENHADQLAPCVKALAELVGVALADDAPDYFFSGESLLLAQKVLYYAAIKISFFLTAKVGKFPTFALIFQKKLI